MEPVTPPDFAGLFNLPGQISVVGQDARVIVRAAATDAGGDLDHVAVRFSRAWVNEAGELQDTLYFRDSASFVNGFALELLSIGRGSQSGFYAVAEVTARDRAGNYALYGPEDLLAAGAPAGFTLVSEVPDTGGPSAPQPPQQEELVTILDNMIDEALRRLIDLTRERADLRYFYLDDARTDVAAGGELRFGAVIGSGLIGSSGTFTATIYLNRSVETADGATDRITFDIDAATGAGSGAVFLTEANATGLVSVDRLVIDAGGRRLASYARAGLVSAGFDGSFAVADTSQPVTATAAVPDVVLEGSGDLPLTLTLKGGTSGVIVVTLDQAGTEARAGTDVAGRTLILPYDLTGVVGDTTYTLPTISLPDDAEIDGTQDVALTVQVTGQVFANGRDTLTLLVPVRDDELRGTDGDDVIAGLATDDWVHGGAGRDTLSGMEGDDILFGDADADRLHGGTGNDVLDGGAGDDLLDGGAETDPVLAAAMNDRLLGGEGDDVLVFRARGSVDGGTGDDTLLVVGDPPRLGGSGSSAMQVLGGTGRDLVDLSGYGGGVEVHLDQLVTGPFVQRGWYFGGWEDAIGSGYDDKLYGGTSNNHLRGGEGNDTLLGEGGDDRLDGGLGGDLLDGGDGVDTADYGSVAAGVVVDLLLTGAQDTRGAGTDTLGTIENLSGTASSDQLRGDQGANALAGQRGDDRLLGRGGADLLDGEDGNDRLDGGGGRDVLVGGAGRDQLTGGAGADRFAFRPGDTGATIATADTITDFARAEGDRIDLTAFGALTFRGLARFTGAGGELRELVTHGQTLLMADLDGDRLPDFVLRLAGEHVLVAGDFLLTPLDVLPT
jgi:Ca2+-binding RTX toxin-like protein